MLGPRIFFLPGTTKGTTNERSEGKWGWRTSVCHYWLRGKGKRVGQTTWWGSAASVEISKTTMGDRTVGVPTRHHVFRLGLPSSLRPGSQSTTFSFFCLLSDASQKLNMHLQYLGRLSFSLKHPSPPCVWLPGWVNGVAFFFFSFSAPFLSSQWLHWDSQLVCSGEFSFKLVMKLCWSLKSKKGKGSK